MRRESAKVCIELTPQQFEMLQKAMVVSLTDFLQDSDYQLSIV
jgi:hypothetical protein